MVLPAIHLKSACSHCLHLIASIHGAERILCCWCGKDLTDAYTAPQAQYTEREAPAAGPASVATGEEAASEMAEIGKIDPDVPTLGQVCHRAYLRHYTQGHRLSALGDEEWEAVAQAVALAYLEQLREGLAGL